LLFSFQGSVTVLRGNLINIAQAFATVNRFFKFLFQNDEEEI